MSVQITTAMVKGFKANFEILSQQKKSRLRDSVREETLTGEDDYFDQIGAADGSDITDRHGDTRYATTPHSRRKVSAIPWEWADLIDKPDKARLLGDPTSSYVLTAAAAAGRRMDDHIIDAALGTAYTGKAGATSTSFDSDNVVAIGSPVTGLTIAKLLSARDIFWGYDIDEDEELHIAVTGKQLTDLLGTTQVTSADYNTVKALVKGEIDTYLGFKFHRSERVDADANSYRRVICWAKNGLLLGVSREVTVQIDVLPQKRHATQVRVEMDMGATRMEEAKVVEIKCSEA